MIAKDKIILNNLLADSRIELRKIAESEKIPLSTVFDRIERLRKEGIINNFSCLLNYKYLRCPLEYIFFIKGKVSEDYRINHISSLSQTESNFVIAIFKDLSDLDDFKKKLKKEKNKITKEFPIYERIKENGLILD
jgi:DNA-binding Lrp family transcriptional regulator